MFDAYANRDNLACPFPSCSKKGGLCRPHRELVPESMLTEEPDYGRIARYFTIRLQISDLITAEPPQLSSAASKSDAAPVTAGDGPDGRLAPSAGPAAPLPRLVCCVCKVVLRDGPEPVSHGYCIPHFDEAIAKVDAL